MDRPAGPIHDTCMGTSKSRSLHHRLHSFVWPGRTIPSSRPGFLTSAARRGGQRGPAGHCAAARSVLDGPERGARISSRSRPRWSEAEPVCGAHMVRCNLVFGGPWAAQNMMQSSASTTRLRAAVPIWKAVLEPRHVTSTRHLRLADRQAELFACLSATRLPLPWYRVGHARRQEAPLSSPSAAARSAACGRVPRSSPFACGPVR